MFLIGIIGITPCPLRLRKLGAAATPRLPVDYAFRTSDETGGKPKRRPRRARQAEERISSFETPRDSWEARLTGHASGAISRQRVAPASRRPTTYPERGAAGATRNPPAAFFVSADCRCCLVGSFWLSANSPRRVPPIATEGPRRIGPSSRCDRYRGIIEQQPVGGSIVTS